MRIAKHGETWSYAFLQYISGHKMQLNQFTLRRLRLHSSRNVQWTEDAWNWDERKQIGEDRSKQTNKIDARGGNVLGTTGHWDRPPGRGSPHETATLLSLAPVLWNRGFQHLHCVRSKHLVQRSRTKHRPKAPLRPAGVASPPDLTSSQTSRLELWTSETTESTQWTRLGYYVSIHTLSLQTE